MRFLLIEAYVKLVECARNIEQASSDIYTSKKILTRWLFWTYKYNFYLRTNKVLDKQYVNIDDVYAWNLFDYKFLVTTILTAIAHLI